MSPAAPKRSPRASYYEILIEGPFDRVHGFLEGLRIGSGTESEFFYATAAGVRTPLVERVREFVHLHSAVSHVIADSDGRTLLKQHAKTLAGLGMSMASEKRIKSGSFPFKYHAYARRYGQEIAELLKQVPAGLKVQAEKPREEIHEGARGVEAYSPAHHYEIEGDGVVSGARIDLLIEARRNLDGHPLVEAGLIELALA